jgi:peptide/nickel transport system substrate-binding protein
MRIVVSLMAAHGSGRQTLTNLRLCLFILAVVVACTLACGKDTPPPASAGTLRIGARGLGEAPRVLREMLFAEPLIALDWQGRPADRLATDWQWSDDGRALTVILRRGVKFHDETPVTSETVADILRQRIKKVPLGFEALERLETPDSNTLVFRLARPDAFLIGVLAGTLIIDQEKPDIGTGPFKIVARTPILEAKKNAEYYRGAPGLDSLQLIMFETQRAAWVALMRGDVDMVQELNPESVEFLQGASGVALYTSLRPFYIPLVFNLHHPILKQVEVRRAITEAIDRDEIVKEAMRGQGQVADDPVWPSHWAYNAATRRHSYNPRAARLRLDAAGFPVKSAGVPGRMASRFEIKCLFWSQDPQFERIALLLQRQLGEIGVNLLLIPASGDTIGRRAGEGDFEAYLFQMTSGRSFDWTYRFWHSSPAGSAELQNSGYSGANQALDELRNARTDSEVRAGVADLRQRFYEDVPAAFLAWTHGTKAVDVRYEVGDPSAPEIWANFWRWRIGPTQRAAK